MDTQLVYRVEHKVHRTGPWAYPESYCFDQLGKEYGYPVITARANRYEWGNNRLWGFRSIKQCIDYFPAVHEAPEDMVLAVYECDKRYVSWDDTQLIFHKAHAIRLVDVQPRDIHLIRLHMGAR